MCIPGDEIREGLKNKKKKNYLYISLTGGSEEVKGFQYEKQFPIISIIFENGNENCHEMRNVMREMVGNT